MQACLLIVLAVDVGSEDVGVSKGGAHGVLNVVARFVQPLEE